MRIEDVLKELRDTGVPGIAVRAQPREVDRHDVELLLRLAPVFGLGDVLPEDAAGVQAGLEVTLRFVRSDGCELCNSASTVALGDDVCEEVAVRDEFADERSFVGRWLTIR